MKEQIKKFIKERGLLCVCVGLTFTILFCMFARCIYLNNKTLSYLGNYVEMTQKQIEELNEFKDKVLTLEEKLEKIELMQKHCNFLTNLNEYKKVNTIAPPHKESIKDILINMINIL